MTEEIIGARVAILLHDHHRRHHVLMNRSLSFFKLELENTPIVCGCIAAQLSCDHLSKMASIDGRQK